MLLHICLNMSQAYTYKSPLRFFSLGQFYKKFSKYGEFLSQNDSFKAQLTRKASFSHISIKSVEPINQGAEPML